MKVTIQTVHFDADRRLEEFIHERIDKLINRYKSIIHADVVLRLQKSESQENKIAEIKLEIPGNNLFVKKQSKSFEEAADSAIDVLHRQLEKIKDKR
ncbi:MAG: ribosome hibernation-promoting factor, HPF/YfiA family [Bacteroidales bacterium]